MLNVTKLHRRLQPSFVRIDKELLESPHECQLNWTEVALGVRGCRLRPELAENGGNWCVMSNDELKAALVSYGAVEPTGQVAFQLLFALYSALKGMDPILDARITAAVDNTVAVIQASAQDDDSAWTNQAALNLIKSFQISLADDEGPPSRTS
jgi:hypothetical protein